jgi:hypothetical protein
MSTARQVRRRRKPDCRIELTRPPKPDAAGEVVITLDGQAQEYTLTPLPCQFGAAAFRVGKIELVPTEPDESPQPRETARYHVHLDGARSSCTCRGFRRWRRRCKHLNGLADLRQRNLI